jgi:RAD51-like protein 2
MWLTRQEQIVLTSTLATKLVNADGTLGNFDTGASAVMVPALGSFLRISYISMGTYERTGPGYLPASCSFRVIFVPRARDSGCADCHFCH